MKILPKIEKLKKKLAEKKSFINFYKRLYNKIQTQDQRIKSFININKKINFNNNKSLPLQNIPISIKDLVHFKGLKCTSGSLVFKNRFSIKNAKIVDRLLTAGSQIIGKTNQVEFAYGSWGTNRFYGTTINPLDRKIDRVCGGSSSGSAASVVAGFVAASIGTDTGGSIRVPAAYCGVFGLKTSRGRIPLDGVESLTKEFDTIGIFANNIDDIDDVFKVISDQYKSKNINKFNLLYLPDDFFHGFSENMMLEYKKFLLKLKKSNFLLSKIDIKQKNNFFVNKTNQMMSYRGYKKFKKYIENDKFIINEDVKSRLLSGKKITFKQFKKTQLKRKKHIVTFNKIIEDNIIITPVTKYTAPKITEVNQKELPSEYCRFVNYLDLCSITFVIKRNKLPIVVQAIAKKGNDEMCINFVKELYNKKILTY